MKTSCKFHRIPGTQSLVITKVHDLLGQPSYISGVKKLTFTRTCYLELSSYMNHFPEEHIRWIHVFDEV